MTPQAHLIGNDFASIYDIFVLVAFLCLCMVACCVWLATQKRSLRFHAFTWLGFLVLLSLGTVGLSISVHMHRLDWRDACSKLVASYAHVISNLEHEKIHPGNPGLFSDWLEPFLLPVNQREDHPTLSIPPPSEGGHFAQQNGGVIAPALEKLAVPENLTAQWQELQQDSDKPVRLLRRNQWAVAALTDDSEAFGRCTKQISVRWNSVPQATTYRLEWKQADSGKTDDWYAAYSGAKPFCTLTAPEGFSLMLRVRAEEGTPEDDPLYNKLVELLDFPARANHYVGYVYTMRYVDAEWLQFIVAPISDANHNGFIDAHEKPTDIGEFYPMEPLFQYIAEHKERTMHFVPSIDQWGQWFTVAEPFWTPDNEMYILGMDFRVDVVQRELFFTRLYHMCVFALVQFFYFGAVALICRLQIRAETISVLAEELHGTISDLTEAKHVTEKALQVKTAFLTNMSHEFRTPLNAMLGFTEVLAHRSYLCTPTERSICAEAVKHMRESGKNLLMLVDDVLNVAALGTATSMQLVLKSVHLRNLIDEVADSMRSRAEYKSLTLTVSESQNVPEWIQSDPAHLRQVLWHLMDNAIKFTAQGSVTIHYGIEHKSGECQPSDESQPDSIYISLTDTGIGIVPEQLKEIFEPFSQTDPSLTRQYGGMGIGLSVAKQSAEMLNGHITVESQPGQGSTFTFTFPGNGTNPTPDEKSNVLRAVKIPITSSPPTETPPSPDSEPEQSLAGCRILYVEDTKVNQIVLSRQLEKVGATVELADNGRIGIDTITEATAQGKPFDVILMDMQMPVLDGYEATRHLRAEGYTKPIIAVTAHALTDDREKTLEAGCNEYVSKPVDFASLIDRIKMFWK